MDRIPNIQMAKAAIVSVPTAATMDVNDLLVAIETFNVIFRTLQPCAVGRYIHPTARCPKKKKVVAGEVDSRPHGEMCNPTLIYINYLAWHSVFRMGKLCLNVGHSIAPAPSQSGQVGMLPLHGISTTPVPLQRSHSSHRSCSMRVSRSITRIPSGSLFCSRVMSVAQSLGAPLVTRPLPRPVRYHAKSWRLPTCF